MVMECSTNRRGEECVQGFSGKTRRKETDRKTWRIILKMDYKEMGWGGMDFIHLADARGQ
jgi:hypothetical protein